MLSVFGQTGAPQKEGAHRPDGVAHQRNIFWPVHEGLFMACCDIHLVQHDNLWPINIIRLPNLESRISNQVTSSKTAYICNAEFMVSFCTLMSENLC